LIAYSSSPSHQTPPTRRCPPAQAWPSGTAVLLGPVPRSLRRPPNHRCLYKILLTPDTFGARKTGLLVGVPLAALYLRPGSSLSYFCMLRCWEPLPHRWHCAAHPRVAGTGAVTDSQPTISEFAQCECTTTIRNSQNGRAYGLRLRSGPKALVVRAGTWAERSRPPAASRRRKLLELRARPSVRVDDVSDCHRSTSAL
jgi:hypothetical protein